jgi:predicted CXXCH cytochrome family protein
VEAPESARTSKRRWTLLFAGIASVALGGGVVWWIQHTHGTTPYSEQGQHASAADFVDEGTCASCHAAEHQAWTGSHHDRAMQAADRSTVLGDFSSIDFVHRGARSTFSEHGGAYSIRASGADGKPADFPVKYTFGVDPLQQYLLELPGGRLQAYTVAWDVDRKRWFDLYPDQRIDAHDELHWTKPSQNWNYMCAECHSTDLHKNYDSSTATYHTSYARVDVGCQACHGPGARHVQWAQGKARSSDKRERASQVGLAVDMAARDTNLQIETCARCHSRRAAFWGDYQYGQRLMDTHLPTLLDEGLYHADGQIQGEVYEYGSFLQSRMYAKGVRCSDCHEPHTAKLRAQGNALCVTCHNATASHARETIDVTTLKHRDYDSPAHHFHKAGSPGAQCVNCHMAERTYMVIDPRRDHSLRIPRPDLSVKLATPNACNLCHTDKSAQWASDAVARWYGPSRRHEPHFGEALWAGRTRQVDAAGRLAALARDSSQPDIARATALQLLRQYPGSTANEIFRDALSHSDPLIRRAALESLDGLPPAQRAALATPLLSDPVRAVRIDAARLLASSARDETSRSAFEAALAEYISAQRENADRPEGHLNLGSLYIELRQSEQAQTELNKAIELDPAFVPAYVNLAELQRTNGTEQQAEETLRRALQAVPNSAPLHHALGLSLVRQQRGKEALAELAIAAKKAPDDPRYAYVYGVALHDLGDVRSSVAVLGAALVRYPGDRDLLAALASYASESGDAQAAARYKARLQQVEADNPR